MIRHIKIGVNEYPFSFGQRAFYQLQGGRGIALSETGEALRMDFDVMLDVLCAASKRGAERTGRLDLALRRDELEDIMDDDATAYESLVTALNEAIMHRLADTEGQDDAGKP
jgi:hypothetical protein